MAAGEEEDAAETERRMGSTQVRTGWRVGLTVTVNGVNPHLGMILPVSSLPLG